MAATAETGSAFQVLRFPRHNTTKRFHISADKVIDYVNANIKEGV